jgi:hypothetical protein
VSNALFPPCLGRPDGCAGRGGSQHHSAPFSRPQAGTVLHGPARPNRFKSCCASKLYLHLFKLEAFSIQLLHHRVNFNACGLFELGLPLVVSVRSLRSVRLQSMYPVYVIAPFALQTLGAVTTYLVVLLQLRAGPSDVPANATSVQHD